MLVAIAIASYAINVVYMEFARTELQITADLATRAACRALVDTGSESEAQVAAQRLANANPVRGEVVNIPAEDLHFSVARRFEEEENYVYSNSLANPNSVNLTAEFFQRSQSGLALLFPTLGVPVAFRPLKEATAIQSELDLAIVVDRSSSMGFGMLQSSSLELPVQIPAVRNLPPDTRYRVAQTGLTAILDLFDSSPQQESVCLATFANLAMGDVELTQNYTSTRSKLQSYGDYSTGGQSSIADGIQNGLNLLSNEDLARPWASRVMLLISDGRKTFGGNPLTVAQAAAEEYVMIYTISLSSEADQSLMTAIAETTRGEHFHVTDASQFRPIMEEISRRLPILITH